MKTMSNCSIIFSAILALQVGFTQQSFADHSRAEGFEERTQAYDHQATLALEAIETEIKKNGYDRVAYRASLVGVNHWDLKDMQLGLRTKATFACTGTVLLTGLTGIVDSVPILNLLIVKQTAMETVDRDSVREMIAEAQENNSGNGDAHPTIYASIFLGAGIASVGGPSRAYIGTRIAHEGYTRVMGCRQSLLKLEDIEHALNLLRAD
ncbi:MAG: hypothetical protein AABY53_09860 [Bdellovibrionota bacterium]